MFLSNIGEYFYYATKKWWLFILCYFVIISLSPEIITNFTVTIITIAIMFLSKFYTSTIYQRIIALLLLALYTIFYWYIDCSINLYFIVSLATIIVNIIVLFSITACQKYTIFITFILLSYLFLVGFSENKINSEGITQTFLTFKFYYNGKLLEQPLWAYDDAQATKLAKAINADINNPANEWYRLAHHKSNVINSIIVAQLVGEVFKTNRELARKIARHLIISDSTASLRTGFANIDVMRERLIGFLNFLSIRKPSLLSDKTYLAHLNNLWNDEKELKFFISTVPNSDVLKFRTHEQLNRREID